MEWYTLDNSLRRAAVIEGFQSIIWSERYSVSGDFQIVTTSNPDNRQMFTKGILIAKKDSFYVMIVQTVLDTVDDAGIRNLTITGRSIEVWLDDRVAMPALASLTATPTWNITGTPGYIARYIFSQVCVTGVLSANDAIPFYHSGTLIPPGTIPEPTDVVTINFDPDTVYNSIKKVCDIWSLGFRLVKNEDLGQIYFEVYTGDDRTTDQTGNAPVIFSMEMDTIDRISTVVSNAATKTVAYVFATNGSAIVYAEGFDSTVSGSDRRVLLVNASDIDLPAGAPLNAAMQQKGTEELAKYNDVYNFEGETPQHVPYVYGRDYNLGDLVEEHSSDGYISQMLVTEQIFVSDAQGERAYPTLTLSNTINPGTWLAHPATEYWDNVVITEYWDNA